MTSPIVVHVERPTVAGETVSFRWTQSEPNPFQQRNEFFFRYDGIELDRFSSHLFFEIFLALQLKVFAAYDRPVELIFPEPVPHTTAAYWRAFHDADQVTISPLSDAGSYSPWKSPPSNPLKPRKAAVFFGGGKDSTTTTCLLSELYGPDNVLLVQSVGPLRPDPVHTDKLERRQEGLMLRPARERLGVATQVIRTDYQAIFHGLGHENKRPHLELYTAGALPALLWWGISLATFCIEWTQYGLLQRPGGGLSFHYAKSRPEVLATQSTHYRRVLGVDLAVTDLNLLMAGPVAYRLLNERYPHALEQIVPCTHAGVDERWCYECWKCANHALYSLMVGYVDPLLDYDRIFGESRFVRRLMTYAGSGVELTPSGNAPWQPFAEIEFFHPFHSHSIASLDPDLIASRLEKQAYANLMTMKALFGHCRYPYIESLPLQVVRMLDHGVVPRIARIVSEHVETVDRISGPFPEGIHFDFDLRMPTRMEHLDHIRTAGGSA